MGVHSLRVGGATALWVGTGGNGPVVRRLGRWASDAVHSYLWDLPVLTEGMTTAMVTADTLAKAELLLQGARAPTEGRGPPQPREGENDRTGRGPRNTQTPVACSGG